VLDTFGQADGYRKRYQELLDSPSELIGIRGESKKSHIRNITFENITLGDQRLDSLDQIEINEFVQNVTIQ
jgi:hypothetical protein